MRLIYRLGFLSFSLTWEQQNVHNRDTTRQGRRKQTNEESRFHSRGVANIGFMYGSLQEE